MFVLKKEASYYWPVKITSPSGDGKREVSSFDAEFKRLSQSRLTELLKDENATDVGFAKEVVVGWRGVKDEDGNDIVFSQAALDQALEFTGFASAISTAYLDSVSQVKRKN